MSRKWKHLHQEIEDDLEEHNCYNDVAGESERDRQLIFTCVKEGNVSQLRRCLDRGVYTNVTNVYKQTPLHIAAGLTPSDASKEILYLLISFGCPVNARDRFGQTVLHVASETSADSVQMLLDAGCNVNAQDNAGLTPLMLACQSSSQQVLNIVQYLMDRGANVDLKDADGQTALHKACTYRQDQELSVKNEIIYKLLYAGAEINIADVFGRTPAYLFMDTPAVSENTSQMPIDVRPLVCGGAKFLENHYLAQELIKCSGIFLPMKCRVNVILYLIDLCGPVSRLSTLREIRDCVRSIENPTDVTKSIVDTLNKRLRTVRSLKTCCRIVVRESLHNRIFLHADKLKLPIHLEKYLKYNECV